MTHNQQAFNNNNTNHHNDTTTNNNDDNNNENYDTSYPRQDGSGAGEEVAPHDPVGLVGRERYAYIYIYMKLYMSMYCSYYV